MATAAAGESEDMYDDRSLFEDDAAAPPADTASGYAAQQAEGYAKAEGNDYVAPKVAVVEGGYHAGEAEKKDAYEGTGEYKAQSAYVDMDAYSKTFVGPACNRLVVFLAIWSMIMLFITLTFGCCMFRHVSAPTHVAM